MAETEAPIFSFNRERPRLVRETIARALEDSKDPMVLLNDAAFFENRRLDKAKSSGDLEERKRWQHTARNLSKWSPAERAERLREEVERYVEDIAGNFDQRVFRLSTRLLPPVVTTLMSPNRLPSFIRKPKDLFKLDALSRQIRVEGNTERLKKLAQQGTLVFIPTHSSNMDSIVFGFALERSGLPPATYGAGKNLFTNPLLSFFMHNLGAYRVDRRLQFSLYKNCLKAYSSVLIENGFHSLFFPGGTRSRSGGIEQRLKLGLMGTGLEAYVQNLRRNRGRKVFFVPATINYLITLEAESLIGDFLRETGRERYIIEDDESSRLGRVASFVRKLLTMQGSVVVRFGDPLDPYGLTVDDEGRSYDRRGRSVDPRSYVEAFDGTVVQDAGRDRQYTRELGERVAEEFKRNTVVMPTNIVAAACFEQLRQNAPSGDLFSILRVRGHVVDRDTLSREVLRIRDRLVDLEKSESVLLNDSIRTCSGGDIVSQAMGAMNGFHTREVLAPRHDGVLLDDPNLLFYYQNRLTEFGLGWQVGS